MLLFFLAALSTALLIALILLVRKLFSLRSEIAELRFGKSSQAVKFGKIAEQWLPFADQFPFETGQFRFLGSPIDGIVFSDNAIIFCEFKASSSRLSEKQRRIKELVQNKRVQWFELRAR